MERIIMNKNKYFGGKVKKGGINDPPGERPEIDIPGQGNRSIIRILPWEERVEIFIKIISED